MTIEAFMDESGTHKGSDRVCVAAMAGPRWKWKKFLSYWDDRYFHAKDSKCDPLKPALFDAIQFGELEGVTAWMKPEDYNGHTSHQFRSAMGNAYAVCAFACAIGVCKHAHKNKLGKVAFIIEDGQPNAEWIREVLESMKARGRLGIASVGLANKRDFVQLCAADFLAHARTSDAEWFDRLDDSGRVSQAHITSHTLAGMSAEITENLRLMKRQKSLLKAQNRRGATLRNDDARPNAKGHTA